MTTAIDLAHISELYRTHRDDLARVRTHMRTHQHHTATTPRLDDLEAEITYLLLRHNTPATVLQIGTGHGWSTTWILHALHDNDTGHLHSFDTQDHTPHHIPHHLTGRWTFTHGDVRTRTDHIPTHTDHLFIDAAHHGLFARWYLHHLLPALPPGIPVSIHDVFHQRHALPFTEGAVVLKWLTTHTTSFFTASAARAPHHHQALTDLKKELGLTEPVRTGHRNPTIYFRLPHSATRRTTPTGAPTTRTR
ncbi:class I SAM-dependent methyltransferase [Nocardiopsis aegyptia]